MHQMGHPADPASDPRGAERFGRRSGYMKRVARGSRKAKVQDVHDLALAMPHVTVERGTANKPVYQVGGKCFIFFRNARPDAFDPVTGERYTDVIVFWVLDESDKYAMVQDEGHALLHHAPFPGPPVGAAPGEPDQRAQLLRTCRGRPGRVAVPGVAATSYGVAQGTSGYSSHSVTNSVLAWMCTAS